MFYSLDFQLQIRLADVVRPAVLLDVDGVCENDVPVLIDHRLQGLPPGADHGVEVLLVAAQIVAGLHGQGGELVLDLVHEVDGLVQAVLLVVVEPDGLVPDVLALVAQEEHSGIGQLLGVQQPGHVKVQLAGQEATRVAPAGGQEHAGDLLVIPLQLAGPVVQADQLRGAGKASGGIHGGHRSGLEDEGLVGAVGAHGQIRIGVAVHVHAAREGEAEGAGVGCPLHELLGLDHLRGLRQRTQRRAVEDVDHTPTLGSVVRSTHGEVTVAIAVHIAQGGQGQAEATLALVAVADVLDVPVLLEVWSALEQDVHPAHVVLALDVVRIGEQGRPDDQVVQAVAIHIAGGQRVAKVLSDLATRDVEYVRHVPAVHHDLADQVGAPGHSDGHVLVAVAVEVAGDHRVAQVGVVVGGGAFARGEHLVLRSGHVMGAGLSCGLGLGETD